MNTFTTTVVYVVTIQVHQPSDIETAVLVPDEPDWMTEWRLTTGNLRFALALYDVIGIQV